MLVFIYIIVFLLQLEIVLVVLAAVPCENSGIKWTGIKSFEGQRP